jgi:hypothetical protein
MSLIGGIERRPERYAAFLTGGGEMGMLIRQFDWTSTSLGLPALWPQSLRSALSILLSSRAQICLFWGADLTTTYNDAYRPTLGIKHPHAFGRPAREVWSEFWEDVLRPLLKGVLHSGEPFWANDYPFFRPSWTARPRHRADHQAVPDARPRAENLVRAERLTTEQHPRQPGGQYRQEHEHQQRQDQRRVE